MQLESYCLHNYTTNKTKLQIKNTKLQNLPAGVKNVPKSLKFNKNCLPLRLAKIIVSTKTTNKTVDSLSYKTISANAATVTKQWYVVDATDVVLGRLSSQIAKILRGKNKPSYTPHVDCGDNVIVINADKVRLTGKKLTDKVYVRHTDYPGGQRFTTPRQYLDKKPTFLVEKAVKGMLPKTRLGSTIFGNLHVYAAAEHPHAAQTPKELKINDIL